MVSGSVHKCGEAVLPLWRLCFRLCVPAMLIMFIRSKSMLMQIVVKVRTPRKEIVNVRRPANGKSHVQCSVPNASGRKAANKVADGGPSWDP